MRQLPQTGILLGVKSKMTSVAQLQMTWAQIQFTGGRKRVFKVANACPEGIPLFEN